MPTEVDSIDVHKSKYVRDYSLRDYGAPAISKRRSKISIVVTFTHSNFDSS
jgi:hypothetical protein